MTNYDMFKKMNIDELTSYLKDLTLCDKCAFYDINDQKICASGASCNEGIKLWLMREVD